MVEGNCLFCLPQFSVLGRQVLAPLEQSPAGLPHGIPQEGSLGLHEVWGVPTSPVLTRRRAAARVLLLTFWPDQSCMQRLSAVSSAAKADGSMAPAIDSGWCLYCWQCGACMLVMAGEVG